MNKFVSAVVKAGTVGLLGYEIGSANKETQIVRTGEPYAQVDHPISIHKQTDFDITEVLKIILLILLIIFLVAIMRFILGKKQSRPEIIQV